MSLICGTGDTNLPRPGSPDFTGAAINAIPTLHGIRVWWTFPVINSQAVSHFNLYRAPGTDPATKTKIAVLKSNQFIDVITEVAPTTYYYWVEGIDIYGVTSQLIGYTQATSVPLDVELAAELTGALGEAQLSAALLTRLNQIEALQVSLATETSNRIANDQTLADALGGVEFNGSDITDALAAEEAARIAADGVLTADVATNAANIASNDADIATNTADIATNTADIATNTADIATNTADIAANTADIATNTADIATNTADIATNTADISSNTADISTNTAAIAANTAAIALNTAATSDNADEITALKTLSVSTKTVSYTLVLADALGYIRMNAAALTLTVPDNATEAFAIGTTVSVRNINVADLTLAGDVGVTLNGSTTVVQDADVLLIKVGTDEWDITH